MTIIDTVKMPGYTQWIENFVERTLNAADVAANTVRIAEMYNKRIYLVVDAKDYMIHTKNFVPAKKDQNGMVCSEDVEYALYVGHESCEDPDEPISLYKRSFGMLNIEWVNDPEIYNAECAQYVALHGEPEALSFPQDGEYIMLHIEDLNQSTFDLKMDIRPLSADEAAAAVKYLTTGEIEESFKTPRMVRYINSVLEQCAASVIDFCFDEGVFDFDYVIRLIARCQLSKRCCAECAIEESKILTRLYGEYAFGDEVAERRIKGNLLAFFNQTNPFTISVI